MSPKEFLSARAHKSELGVAVFVKDKWQNTSPVMLSSEPVVETHFRVEQVLRWSQAIDMAIQCIEEHERTIKPTPALSDALNELSMLQGRLEGMAEDCHRMHKEVVEHISEHQPDLMQDYLSAFTRAVGQGDL